MLVWACIAPHGGEVIPELASGCPDRMAATRRAMEELGRRCRRSRPETLVVLTPHGLCVEHCVSVSVARVGYGHVDGENGVRVAMRFGVDAELAGGISAACEAGSVRTTEIGYTADGAPMPVFPLDWGVLVPAYFLGAQWDDAPQVVVACPDRSMPRADLVRFGECVVQAAAQVGRRVALVCSADLGHGHAEDGPYGYSPHSTTHDQAYCRAVRDGALARLLNWRNDRIEASLTDSYWQTLMLHGALTRSELAPELLSYEAPTYFGMACAAFDGR